MVQSKTETRINESLNNPKALGELLQKFLFDSEDLDAIKRAVAQHAKGEITSKDLKQSLLNSRIAILEELKRFFPFYATYSKSKGGDDSHTDGELDKANQTINNLTQQLKERDALLQEIIPRIQHLEHLLGLSNTTQSSPPKLSEVINLQEELQQAIEHVELEEWLRAFRKDADGNIKRNDSQFFQDAFTALQSYHKKHFSIPRTTKIPNLEVLEALDLPQEIKDGLYRSLSVRTNLSHDFYEENTNDVELMYTSYFHVIFYLLSAQLKENVKNKFRHEIITYFTELITKVIKNEDYISKIAINVLNETFN